MKLNPCRAIESALVGSILALLGCSPGGEPGRPLLAPVLASESDVTTVARTLRDVPTFDPANFVPSVDHPFHPLVPGTIHTFAGTTNEGLETTEIEVLREKKFILGVECTVVRDRVSLEGSLIEDTFDWFAQDTAGNVWYLGEDVKDYDNGVIVSTAGSWEAGKDGAQAGIIMNARPRIGDTYRQEYAPGSAEDMATIVSLKKTASVPYGNFDGCLQIMEFSPLAPGARGYKYYARGVGMVLEDSPRGGHERSELISVSGP